MIDEILNDRGYSPSVCVRLVESVVETPKSHSPILRLKEELLNAGVDLPHDKFERGLLAHASRETSLRIERLPVYESVKSLLREELRFYTESSKPGGPLLEIGSYLFTLACKIVSLRRFPSGPMDWEISGFPRSWLARIKKRDLPRILRFVLFELGGFAPVFFMHVARKPKNRSLSIEREVLQSYYRMARSLEFQPAMKGIVASAWFHDPAVVKQYPHLACLSRPYLEAGGLITTAGLAPVGSGYAEHNLERKAQVDAGKLRFEMGIAMWPRRNALQWAHSHPELQS